MPLETEPSDLGPLSAMHRDAKFQRFYSERDCDEAHWRTLIEQFVAESAQRPRTRYNLAVTLKSDRRFIGAAGIRLEDRGQASAGCALDRRAQARGLALEAMEAVVEFGFTELGVQRLYAETIADNRAAIALCRRLGMRREAEFVQHRYFKGRWWNTVLLAMSAEAWRAGRSGPIDDRQGVSGGDGV